MLSFEEFFIKKKIDLFALKSANQELYREFEVHYRAMGEKSFDHSKKFWFNKLRKSYLLTEEADLPKNSSPKETASPVDIEPAKTSAKLGFKPKFGSKPTSKSVENTKTSQETSNVPPSGFKPRFKPDIIKMTPQEEPAPITNVEPPVATEEEAKASGSKPAGFKPRFKAGVTKGTAPVEKAEEPAPITNIEPPVATEEEAKASGSKPAGFKPRFKAGVTKGTAPVEKAEEPAPITNIEPP
ncbi:MULTISPECIES: hypothetical protein, partial [Sphingobacterium]|uniref:hypothetical protein n=1 Tax=Sphingobacterium TaxID=28453 RepID=UPI001969E750